MPAPSKLRPLAVADVASQVARRAAELVRLEADVRRAATTSTEPTECLAAAFMRLADHDSQAGADIAKAIAPAIARLIADAGRDLAALRPSGKASHECSF